MQMNAQRLADQIFDALRRNGFPDRTVRLPYIQLYRPAVDNGFALDDVLTILERDRCVHAKRVDDRIVFQTAPTAVASVNGKQQNTTLTITDDDVADWLQESDAQNGRNKLTRHQPSTGMKDGQTIRREAAKKPHKLTKAERRSNDGISETRPSVRKPSEIISNPAPVRSTVRRDVTRHSPPQPTGSRDIPKQENVATCPRCGSSSLLADKTNYELGLGAAGAVVFGPIGLLMGGLNSGRINVACIKCGHKFHPGT